MMTMKKRCSCRTTSLSIFVQSLTELRLSNPTTTITRSAASHVQHGNGFPTLARYLRPTITTTHTLSRPFTAASASCSPRQKLKGSSAPSSQSGEAFQQSHQQQQPQHQQPQQQQQKQHPTSDTNSNHPPTTTSAPTASIGDLDRARRDGAILDFTPESIDSLIAGLEDTSVEVVTSSSSSSSSSLDGPLVYRPEPATPNLSHSGPPPAPPRPPPSNLKRRKILKPEPEPQPEAPPPYKEDWKIQKAALRQKFPGGWAPRKRLSPDALDGIRALHAQFPQQYTTRVLASQFAVSPEAVRRILRARWRPDAAEEEDRQARWFGRGKHIWARLAELGRKPPRRWRQEGVVRDLSWNVGRGPRTEYPYVPRKKAAGPPPSSSSSKAETHTGTGTKRGKGKTERKRQPDEEKNVSVQRKLSGTLL